MSASKYMQGIEESILGVIIGTLRDRGASREEIVSHVDDLLQTIEAAMADPAQIAAAGRAIEAAVDQAKQDAEAARKERIA